jgi:hypothetical protein
MTLDTVGAELAAVDVVAAVTADTSARQSDRAVDSRFAVAAEAVEPGMRAVEREIGLDVVIEAPYEPIERRMAKRTIRTQPRVVRVLFDVAVHA